MAVVQEWKYVLGQTLVWGPKTEYSTAPVQYCNGAYQLCLAVNLAFIHPGNVKAICSDISQQFPPRRVTFLLGWVDSPHCSIIGSQYNISFPQLSDESLLGGEWYSKYNVLLKVKQVADDICNANNISASLRQCMAHQWYCYGEAQSNN